MIELPNSRMSRLRIVRVEEPTGIVSFQRRPPNGNTRIVRADRLRQARMPAFDGCALRICGEWLPPNCLSIVVSFANIGSETRSQFTQTRYRHRSCAKSTMSMYPTGFCLVYIPIVLCSVSQMGGDG